MPMTRIISPRIAWTRDIRAELFDSSARVSLRRIFPLLAVWVAPGEESSVEKPSDD
jgi:hypothetical protein